MKLSGAQIREYTRDYQRLVEKYASEGITVHTRERIAKDMGLSVQQADRYKKINLLITDIQEPLAPHERLTDLAVIPREKPHTGAAAREQPRDSPVIER